MHDPPTPMPETGYARLVDALIKEFGGNNHD